MNRMRTVILLGLILWLLSPALGQLKSGGVLSPMARTFSRTVWKTQRPARNTYQDPNSATHTVQGRRTRRLLGPHL